MKASEDLEKAFYTHIIIRSVSVQSNTSIVLTDWCCCVACGAGVRDLQGKEGRGGGISFPGTGQRRGKGFPRTGGGGISRDRGKDKEGKGYPFEYLPKASLGPP